MSDVTLHVSWEAVTAAGVTICTFGDAKHAKAWVAIRKSELPGAYVERVTTTISRERAYTPRRAMLRVVGQ